MSAAAPRGSGWSGEPIARRPGATERIPPGQRPDHRGLRLRAAVWSAAWEFARWLPEPLAFALAAAAGRLAHRLLPGARLRVRRNLAPVVGAGADPAALDGVVRAAFTRYARYWVEAFRAADVVPADLDRRTTTDGLEHLDAALRGGRGAIVLLAHHGSWDLAARWAETHGYHVAAVAEIVRPRRLFEKFVRLREAIGVEVVPLRRGADLAGRLEQVLAANHLVALLADRDLSRDGPVVRLFGQPCRIPPGPVVLAQRTHALVVPVTLLQQPGRRWHLQVLPALDVAALPASAAFAAVARALEALIRTDPAQWHAFSPVWEADLPPRGEETAHILPRDVGTS